MNLFIKAPLIGVMNFNSYVFKTKIHLKKTLSKVAYQIKYGSIVFLENWSFILKGANMNFKHKFKNWFCYERDIKIKTNKKDCKYAWKKKLRQIKFSWNNIKEFIESQLSCNSPMTYIDKMELFFSGLN